MAKRSSRKVLAGYKVTYYRRRTTTGGSVGILRVREKRTGKCADYLGSKGEWSKSSLVRQFKETKRLQPQNIKDC